MLRRLLIPLLAVACGGGKTATEFSGVSDTGLEVDEDPPVISHTPISESQPIRVPVLILATVTDNLSGVAKVELSYKREDKVDYTTVNFNIQDANAGTWSAEIPGADIVVGTDYFLHALDVEGNESFAPTDGGNNPYHFRVDGG